MAVKALGDAAQDLSYTPVSPCRLFDTRPSQGGLGTMVPSVRRTYGATAPVASQGGPGGCTAGAGAAVALIQIGTVAPAGSGLLQGGPQGVGSFPNALILYQAGDQYGTAVAMPLNAANGQFDLQVLFAGTDLYADLLGYFKAPSGGFVTAVTPGTGIAVTGTTAPTVAVASSYQLPQACTNGQVAKSNGSGGWTCAADANSGGTVTSVTATAGGGLATTPGAGITATGSVGIATGGVGTAQLADVSVTTPKIADGGVTAAKLASNGCTSGQILKYDGANWSCAADNTATGAFIQGGNAFGVAAILGTTDNNAMEIDVNSTRVMHYDAGVSSPNLVGGHPNNSVAGAISGATVAGGGQPGTNCLDLSTGTNTHSCGNRALASYASVGGGFANTGGDIVATVGGGSLNTAATFGSTVSGGTSNRASGTTATVGGGGTNVASGNYSIVGGGAGNTAGGSISTIGGGDGNSISAAATASTIAGGFFNSATGANSAIPGGANNTASGIAAVAAGQSALADQDHCFVFGGWSNATPISCLSFPSVVRFGVDHGFSVEYGSPRPDGGGNKYVYIGDVFAGKAIWTSTGAYLSDPGGVWTNSSDRHRKEDVSAIDARDVLARVVDMPITRWRYIGEDESKHHIGPMAQDFYAQFRLGDDDTHIATVDADGVALAAIQGLNAKLDASDATARRSLQEKDAKIDAQAARITELERDRRDRARRRAGKQASEMPTCVAR